MADDNPHQDIHDALGILPTDLGVGTHGVLHVDPLAGAGGGPGVPAARTPLDVMRDVYHAGWRQNVQGATGSSPTTVLNNFIQRFNDRTGSTLSYPSEHVDTWRQEARNAYGPLAPLSRGQSGTSNEDWDQMLHNITAARQQQAPPRANIQQDTPESRLAYYQQALREGRINQNEYQGFREALAPAQGSLSERAISQHLASNPGASIFDVAGVRPSAAENLFGASGRGYSDIGLAGTSPLTRETEPTSGPMGNLSKTVRDAFNEHLAPHYPGGEREFLDKFFGGMGKISPDGVSWSPSDKSFSFSGSLQDPTTGRRIGSISRSINMDAGTAYHGYLSVNPDFRDKGLVPNMLRNQVDLYQKMGLKSVGVDAGLDVGRYAWAKYGFVPKPYDWQAVSGDVKSTADSMRARGAIDEGTHDTITKLANSPDPKSIWAISDLDQPAPEGWEKNPSSRSADRTKTLTLGQSLLTRATSWSAKLDLKDPESLDRFNDYVQRKAK